MTIGTSVADEAAAINEAGSLVAVVRRQGDAWQPVVVMPPEPRREPG